MLSTGCNHTRQDEKLSNEIIRAILTQPWPHHPRTVELVAFVTACGRKRRIVANSELDDVLQDVCLCLARDATRTKIAQCDNPAAYISRMVTNAQLTHKRRQSAHYTVSGIPDDVLNALEARTAAEERTTFAVLVSPLTASGRELLSLWFEHNLTGREIAALTNLKTHQVYREIRNNVRLLQEYYSA